MQAKQEYDLLDLAALQAYRKEGQEDNEEWRQKQAKNLRRAISEELTPRQRTIVTMYFFENKRNREIAEELKVNKSTVSRTLDRAVKRIRKVMRYSA